MTWGRYASGGRIDRPLAIQYTSGDLFVADSGTKLFTER